MQVPFRVDINRGGSVLGQRTPAPAVAGLRHCQQHVKCSHRSTALSPSPSLIHPRLMSQSGSQHTHSPNRGFLGWLQHKWACRSHNSSDAAGSTAAGLGQPAASQQQQQQGSSAFRAAPTHLIVMVNGLFGSAANWDVISEQLKQHLPSDTLLHPSKVNARFSTYQGIDACGQRLADEIRTVVASQPSLSRISVVAHSMGGLMARYAVGALYNPDKSLVCGLQPCHFVSMATPHCGCDADGVAQVPFIGWTGDIPLLGQQLYRFLASINGSTASLIFQRTGQQFFLLDGAAADAAGARVVTRGVASDRAAFARALTAADADRDAAAVATVGSGAPDSSSSSTGQLPLLLQMTQDCPDRGLYFYSALAAFKTRTAYANMDGDHLVGFANSSIRSFDQLPPPPPEASTAKGVVLQDSLSAAFWQYDWQQLQQQWDSRAGAQQQQQQQQRESEPSSAAVEGEAYVAVKQPYEASRDWTYTREQVQHQLQQQQQQQQGLAKSKSSSSGFWKVLSSKGSVDDEHAAAALAALELEAGGATPAATAAVVAAGVAAGSSSRSMSTAAAADVGPDDLHYSRFRAQPGRGGEPLKTVEESAAAAAEAAATATAVEDGGAPTDSLEEVVDLTYRNPLTPQEQQQQQQQQRKDLSPAATAARGAAAVASAEADLTTGLARQGSGPMPVAGSAADAAADVAADASSLGGREGDRAEFVSHMLRRLQELPWRRIDVSFQGAKFGFAHNNIQVTRRWWNFEGRAVPAHLAQQLQLMDTLLLGPEQQRQQQQ